MKISELPEDVRKKALKYQKKANKDLETNDLRLAFPWAPTKESYEYWRYWDIKNQMKPKFEYDSNGVTQPSQYQIGIDTFQRSEANLSKEEIIAICKFNIDKYNWRKKDQDKEDFQKIIDYANWAIKNL
jgi:hypothetical protein